MKNKWNKESKNLLQRKKSIHLKKGSFVVNINAQYLSKKKKNEIDFHVWLVGNITMCQVLYNKYNLIANCS